MLCEYKDMFGKPGEGVHAYRVFNIAIVDVLLTLLLAYAINSYKPEYKYSTIAIGLFALGILLHRVFCVKTTVDKMLFP